MGQYITIPPWDVLANHFGVANDDFGAISNLLGITSDDPKLSCAWSKSEEEVLSKTSNRKIEVDLPTIANPYFSYIRADGVRSDLPISFVEFCVAYREGTVYGTSKTLGGLL